MKEIIDFFCFVKCCVDMSEWPNRSRAGRENVTVVYGPKRSLRALLRLSLVDTDMGWHED